MEDLEFIHSTTMQMTCHALKTSSGTVMVSCGAVRDPKVLPPQLTWRSNTNRNPHLVVSMSRAVVDQRRFVETFHAELQRKSKRQTRRLMEYTYGAVETRIANYRGRKQR